MWLTRPCRGSGSVTGVSLDYRTLRNLDLNLMVALDALVEERSVSGAARRVGVGQPAMSHSLKRLRELLDDAVLERRGSTMVVTERARTVARAVREGLHTIDAALEAAVEFVPATAEEVFRVGMSDHLSSAVGSTLFERLREDAPGCRLGIVNADRVRGAQMLDERQLDLYLGVFKEVSSWHRSELLYREPFIGVTGRPFERDPPDLEAYIERPHVLASLAEDFRGRVDGLLARRGLARRVVLSTPHFHMIPFSIRRNDAVSLVPRSFGEKIAGPFELHLFEPPLDTGDIEFRMLWHDRNDGVSSQRWLRGLLADIGATLGAEP